MFKFFLILFISCASENPKIVSTKTEKKNSETKAKLSILPFEKEKNVSDSSKLSSLRIK